MNKKTLLLSATVLAALGLAAFQWRDTLFGEGAKSNDAVSIVSGGGAASQSPGAWALRTKSPAEPAVPARTAAAAVPVDESALRYFAQAGDTVRLEAEIARLKGLYPGWTPPADPTVGSPQKDQSLDQMWKLYGEGRYGEARKAIADRQAAEPGWQAPENLTGMLALAEARQSLVNASNLKQYGAVIETAATNAGLLTCADADVLWRVAEAFARTDKMARANDAYVYVLDNCSGAGERLATVQKASTLLPVAMVEGLLTKERSNPEGKPEFETIKDGLVRQFVANAGENPDFVVSEPYLTRMTKLAETEDLASDALLLGWYYNRRDRMEEAGKWFRRAYEKDETASAAQGLALSLIDAGDPKEAEAIMYKWRTASQDARDTYLAATSNLLALDPVVPLEFEVLNRIAAETVAQKHAATAQEFGWYSRAFRQPYLALQWFATALGWKADDEPSAFGLTLTEWDLNNPAEVERLKQAWGGVSPRIATVGLDMGGPSGPPVMIAGQVPIDNSTVASVAGRAAYSQVQTPALAYQAGTQTQTYQAAAPAPAYQAVAPAPVYQAAAPVQAYQAAPAPVYQAATPAQTVAMRQEAVLSRRPEQSRALRARRLGACTGVQFDPARLTSQSALDAGWCLMEAKRPAEALKAFEAALAGGPALRGDAAYGQSLAYLRMGLTDNAAVAAARSGMDRKKATELQVAILTDRALAAFANNRYEQALVLLDQRARLTTERMDLMVVRGYSYLGLQRYADAVQVFESVAVTGNRDALRGLAAARDARPSRGPVGGG